MGNDVWQGNEIVEGESLNSEKDGGGDERGEAKRFGGRLGEVRQVVFADVAAEDIENSEVGVDIEESGGEERKKEGEETGDEAE